MEANYKPTYAIWIKKTKNGDDYLSMKTPEGNWITFFQSRNKKTFKSPDWYQAKNNVTIPSGVDFGAEPVLDSNDEIPF